MYTTVLHLDHMNDVDGYVNFLCSWATELGLRGVILLPSKQKPRPRHIFVIFDGQGDQSREFVRRLTTQNVDVNMRGTPCKERQSSFVTTLECSSSATKWNPSTAGLERVDVEATRNPLAHLPFVVEYILERRVEDDSKMIRR